MTRILWRIVCTPGHRFVADVLFVPNDVWLGCYWRHDISTASRHCLHVYICLLPMVPLRLCVVLWHAHQAWPGAPRRGRRREGEDACMAQTR